eukprot:6172534-Pleurochrysis_carterae.AAC.1
MRPPGVQVTPVSPMALLLFGGRLAMDEKASLVTIDGTLVSPRLFPHSRNRHVLLFPKRLARMSLKCATWLERGVEGTRSRASARVLRQLLFQRGGASEAVFSLLLCASDGWVRFRVSTEEARLLLALRSQLDEILRRKVDAPQSDLGGSAAEAFIRGVSALLVTH